MAVANSPAPTHAVPAAPGFEQVVKSLVCHRSYLEALTDEAPETYARRSTHDGHLGRHPPHPNGSQCGITNMTAVQRAIAPSRT